MNIGSLGVMLIGIGAVLGVLLKEHRADDVEVSPVRCGIAARCCDGRFHQDKKDTASFAVGGFAKVGRGRRRWDNLKNVLKKQILPDFAFSKMHFIFAL
jgi:hypothetical protein